MSRVKYNLTLLKSVAERDSAKIIGKYDKLKINVKIKYQCRCGTINEKVFRNCNKAGMLCKKCINTNSSIKRKKTCLEKYGAEHPRQLEQFIEKGRKTCLEKYGVEHPAKSDEIKSKIKKKNLEKYGVDHPMKLDETKNKIKELCLNKYGTEYASQSKIVKDKMKKTCMEKYGVEYSLQSKEVQEKSKNTMLEKYGVDNAMYSEELKNKVKETCLEKYGIEYSLQSEEVREKGKKTNLERYGAENPFQSEEIKDKIKKSLLEKYGVENPLHSEEIKQKVKDTILERYGVENLMHLPEFVEKSFQNSFSQKEFVMPSGDIRLVQGYEPKALKKLITMYEEDDIVTDIKLVPAIDYIYKDKDKDRKYYPDIYIKSENKIIEVKSTFTFNKDLERNHYKGEACTSNGYLFEFWIYSSNNCEGEIIEY